MKTGLAALSSKINRSPALLGSAIAFCCLFWFAAFAQETEEKESYIAPPESVREIFDRDKNFAVLNNLSPDGKHFLVPHGNELSSLERMSRKTYRLAMLEIRPATDREWRLDTYGVDGLEVRALNGGAPRKIEIPDGILVSDTMWSPDGKQIAFFAHLETGSQVWTADIETGKAAPLSSSRVLATLAAGRAITSSASEPRPSRMLQWTPDGDVITLLVPGGRGAEPVEPPVASGPTIRRTRKKPTPTRTLPFLLKSDYDQELFRHYTTSQIALLSAGKEPRLIGPPGMYLEINLSPDGKHLLAERIVEPFSYLVGSDDFPRKLEVIDLDGKTLSTIREMPLREAISRGADRPGADLPRDVVWRPTGGLGFLWREPKKDDKNDEEETESETSEGAKRQDRLMLLEAPFDPSQGKTVASTEKRFSQASYSSDGRFAFATISGRRDNDGKNVERIVAYALEGDSPQERVLVDDYDPNEILKLPGEILVYNDPNGIRRALLSSDRSSVYLRGEGYREDFKPRPFVDRVNLENGTKERVFEGSAQFYERPLVALDDDLQRMVVSRESSSDFPDSYQWTQGQAPRNLTANQDPFPDVTACKRIDFEFTRRDGLLIHGRISLPVGYKEGARVPAMVWTYPREFESKEDYQRSAIRSRNRNEFPELSYLRWSDIWLTQGYALVYPDVPVVGKGDRYNDQYISQLSDTLYAAIRKVDEMGLVDPDRVGHGGHSYGAFATANLLAHTPYFKAGIAGDGAYNRTLTPMSFQRERRFIWDAPHTYLEMSPFFYADQINTPLLMYHGADDNNSGTYPIQSERMIQALTGLGKTAVLYMYPYESHSPRARESVLDLWARWLEWFDKYVKGVESPPGSDDLPSGRN